jgi:hypothetical protein
MLLHLDTKIKDAQKLPERLRVHESVLIDPTHAIPLDLMGTIFLVEGYYASCVFDRGKSSDITLSVSLHGTPWQANSVGGSQLSCLDV